MMLAVRTRILKLLFTIYAFSVITLIYFLIFVYKIVGKGYIAFYLEYYII